MTLRLAKTEAMYRGIRRTSVELLDQARVTLSRFDDSPDRSTHRIRRCMKKMRAIVRLVRVDLGRERYRFENRRYRDLARRFSSLRSHAVFVATLDRLDIDGLSEEEARHFARGREELARRHEEARAGGRAAKPNPERLAEVAEVVDLARRRAESWPLEGDGSLAIRKGLHRTHRKGRDRLRSVQADPSPQRLHDWRKWVKYLWYQSRILRPHGSDAVPPMIERLDRLQKILGGHNDLAELARHLRENPEAFGGKQGVKALLARIEPRRHALRVAAIEVGGHLYREEPSLFTRNFGLGPWDRWEAPMDASLSPAGPHRREVS